MRPPPFAGLDQRLLQAFSALHTQRTHTWLLIHQYGASPWIIKPPRTQHGVRNIHRRRVLQRREHNHNANHTSNKLHLHFHRDSACSKALVHFAVGNACMNTRHRPTSSRTARQVTQTHLLLVVVSPCNSCIFAFKSRRDSASDWRRRGRRRFRTFRTASAVVAESMVLTVDNRRTWLAISSSSAALAFRSAAAASGSSAATERSNAFRRRSVRRLSWVTFASRSRRYCHILIKRTMRNSRTTWQCPRRRTLAHGARPRDFLAAHTYPH